MTALAALILAAGASSRMGRPKAEIEWQGATFFAHALRQARAAGALHVLAVQGAHDLTPLLAPGVLRVHHAAWAQGQFSSIQAGLSACMDAFHPQLSGLLLLTVDRPRVTDTTMRILAEAHGHRPSCLWQVRYQGRLGHPLIVPADLFGDIVGLTSQTSLRALLARPAWALRRAAIEVDDPAVCENLDRPEDLAKLRTDTAAE